MSKRRKGRKHRQVRCRSLLRGSALVAVGLAIRPDPAVGQHIDLWIATNGNNPFSDPTAWGSGTVPAGGPDTSLTFPGTDTFYTAENDLGIYELNSLNLVNGGVNPGQIGGDPLRFTNNSSSKPPAIVEVPGSPGFTFFAPIIIADSELTVNVVNPTPAGAVLFFGPIFEDTVPATIRVTGGGILGIFATNTTTGGIDISGGSAIHTGGISGLGTGPIGLHNGELFITGNGDLTSRTINVGDGGGTFNTSFVDTMVNDLGSVASSTVPVNVIGGGRLTILGNNPNQVQATNSSVELFSAQGAGGGVRLDDGTLRAGADLDFDFAGVPLVVDGTAGSTIDTNSFDVTARDITGTTSTTIPLNVMGNGRLTLRGIGSRAGETIVNQATLELDNPLAAGTGAVRLDDATLRAGADLDFDSAGVQVVLDGVVGNTIDTNAFAVTARDIAALTSTSTIPLAVMGNGRLTLRGIGSRAGETIVNQATLELDNPLAAGTGAVRLDNGTLLAGGDLDFASAGVPLVVDGTAGSTIDTNSFAVTLGSLSGLPSAGLAKFGFGLLKIQDASGYEGIFGLAEGAVQFQGVVNTDIVTLANTRIGGTAQFTRNLSVTADTALAPGDVNTNTTQTGLSVTSNTALVSGNVNAIINHSGSMMFLNGVAFGSSSLYEWGLGALADAATGAGGTEFDLIVVSGGQLRIDPLATLVIGFDDPSLLPQSSDPFWTAPRTWKVIDVTGLASNPGNAGFSLLSNAAFSSGSFDTFVGGGADTGDIFLRFTPVPEPGTFGVLLITSVLLTRRRIPRISLRLEV